MTTAITTPAVQKAAAELARMRRSLMAWLKYRALNDQVMAQTGRVRDPRVEQDLATKLAALLGQVLPGQRLPEADLSRNPNGAVQLAQIAIQGGRVTQGPTATGNILGAVSHPWLWPVLIVGGLLLIVVTGIKTAADVAKDREEKACIVAGACTDYGFWLKAGGVVALAYVAWNAFGKKGRS